MFVTAVSAAVVCIAGCGSPPSVVPTMRLVQQTMLEEAERLETVDAERDRMLFDDSRERLQRGFLADLQQNPTLDPEWVYSAAEVYAAACEALVWQEVEFARQRDTRRDNLRDAAAAQARAIAVLQEQGLLLQRTVGFDLWRLNQPGKEASR
ncbi:MAG: hypothetical protein AAGA25_00355 [Planctomycetota bacterium]